MANRLIDSQWEIENLLKKSSYTSLKEYLENVSEGMIFSGEVNTKAELDALTGALDGDVKVVLVDETRNNARITYIYQNSAWIIFSADMTTVLGNYVLKTFMSDLITNNNSDYVATSKAVYTLDQNKINNSDIQTTIINSPIKPASASIVYEVDQKINNYVPVANISESITSNSNSTVASSNAIKLLSEEVNSNYVSKSNISQDYNGTSQTSVSSQYALNQLYILVNQIGSGTPYKGIISGTVFSTLTSWKSGDMYKTSATFTYLGLEIPKNALIIFKTTVTSGGTIALVDFDVFANDMDFSHTATEIDKATTMTLDADFDKLGWIDINTCDLSVSNTALISLKPKLPATSTHLYINGTRTTLDTELTLQLPTITGVYYIFMTESKVLTYSTEIDYNDFGKMPICFIRYTTSGGVRAVFDLRIWNLLMDVPTRAYIYSLGIQTQKGFDMEDFAVVDVSDSLKLCQFTIANGDIRQSEKLLSYSHANSPINRYENIMSPFTSKLYYIQGTTFTNVDASNVCLKMGTNYPYYNKYDNDTNSYSLVEMSQGKYMAVLVGLSTDIRAGQSTIAIMGQNLYDSYDECYKNENLSTMSLADLESRNFRFLYKVIFHCDADLYTNIYKSKAVGYQDVRKYIMTKSLADFAGDINDGTLTKVDLKTATYISGVKNTVYYIKNGSNGAVITLPNLSLTTQDKIVIEDVDGLLCDTFTITINGELATINGESCSMILDSTHMKVELEWTGSTWLLSFDGNMVSPNFRNKLTTIVSTVDSASLNIPSGITPSTLTNGDIWHDNADKRLKIKDLNGDNYVLNGIIGEIKMFASSTIPQGFLVCNGQEVSKTQYQQLFNVIGNMYGIATINTNFVLPNLCNRFPIGYSTTGTANILGGTGGVNSITLTTNEMPAHVHSYTRCNGNDDKVYGWADDNRTIGNSWSAGNTSSVGNGNAFSIQNPFLALNFIIRY